jgi:superfamily II DNA helicase RecQ
LADDALTKVDFAMLEAKRAREEDRLDEMIGYTATPGCRVRFLLACFGLEEAGSCGSCDRCAGGSTRGAVAMPTGERERETILSVIRAVNAFDKHYGFGKLALHLAGSRSEKITNTRLGRGETYGALKHLGTTGAERWLRTAYDAGLLRLVAHKLQGGGRTVHLIAVAPLGTRVLKGEPLPELHL